MQDILYYILLLLNNVCVKKKTKEIIQNYNQFNLSIPTGTKLLKRFKYIV